MQHREGIQISLSVDGATFYFYLVTARVFEITSVLTYRTWVTNLLELISEDVRDKTLCKTYSAYKIVLSTTSPGPTAY